MMAFHPTIKRPKIMFSILLSQRDSVKRKISEAAKICELKPKMNNRDELVDVHKFVIH